MEKPRQVAGLDLEPAEGGYVVYQPEEDRVHYLNPTAALILQLCDGDHTVAAIASSVRDAYADDAALPPEAVPQTIDRLAEAGLVR